VQYSDGTDCQGSASFIWDNADLLAEITGVPISPFAGLYVGPNESLLPIDIQNYTTGNLRAVGLGGAVALGVEDENGTGIYVASTSNSISATFGLESDLIIIGDGGNGAAYVAAAIADGSVAEADFVYGYYAYAPRVQNGGSFPTWMSYWSGALTNTATDAYHLWFDEQGVYRIKAVNSFNSVYQAVPALYNPQFTKYIPGVPNYERIVQEWNGNISEIGNYAGGTGTVRDLRLLAPTVHFGTASNVSSTTFTGAGVNDGVFNGTYTGATLTYCAIIDATGTPDTFKWGTNGACNNGATGVAITSANQTLSSGAVIKFATTTGHTLNDKWSAVMTAATDLGGAWSGLTGTLSGFFMEGTVAFASLPSTTRQMEYCSDCTVTSGTDNTCAGSGSGAHFEVINGVKKCWQ